jgi:hypothetical protein
MNTYTPQNLQDPLDIVRADEKRKPNWDSPWSTYPHYKEWDSLAVFAAREIFANQEHREWEHDMRVTNYDLEEAKALKIARDYPELMKAAWEKKCREANLWDKIASRIIGQRPIPLEPAEFVPIWLIAILLNLIFIAAILLLSLFIGYLFAIVAAVGFLILGAVGSWIAGLSRN